MSADVALENVGLLGPKEDSFASSYYGAVDSYAAVEPNKPPASWKAIIKDLLSMGMPLAGASVCSTLLPFVSLIFVGHYSTGTTSSDEIAASGLAVMLCNGTSGLLTAADQWRQVFSMFLDALSVICDSYWSEYCNWSPVSVRLVSKSSVWPWQLPTSWYHLSACAVRRAVPSNSRQCCAYIDGLLLWSHRSNLRSLSCGNSPSQSCSA